MHPTLRDFISALDSAGELRRITARTSPVLEIAAITDRESKSRAPNLPSASARRNDPRFHDRGGQALLFENVTNSDIPVLINGWGSYRRMEMALGCDADQPRARTAHDPSHLTGFDLIASRIAKLVKPEPPASLAEAFSKAGELLPLLRMPPKRKSGSGLCQEVVLTGDRVDCTRLPLIRCWPLDGDYASLGYPADINDHIEGLGRGPDWERDFRGRYITLAGIHTIHADDRDHPKPPSHNIGMYRVQLLGPRKLAMHWHMHHDGARHWRSWKALGKPMPVAIVLGGESVLPYAATCPLPPGISELLMAGFLNGSGIPMVRAKTVPLWVPANAEIVIEGWVSAQAGGIGWVPSRTSDRTRPRPGDSDGYSDNKSDRQADRHNLGPGAVFEGPFGDHTGFYSMPDRYPILDVTATTHRRDPIYPTTIVGLPPQEDYYLGKATERLFFPLLKTLIHDIEDYDLPMFGAFHNCAMLTIKKAYPLQGRRVMHSVWGAGQMAWTKTIFIVDDDVDVHDTMQVLRVAGERCHPLRDVEIVNGPLDILDHAAPRLGAGMKIGFDCTRKIEGEEVNGIAVTGPSPSAMLEARHAAEMLDRVRAVARVKEARFAPEGSHGWLLVRIDKRGPQQGRETLRAVFECLVDPSNLPRFIIILSDVDSLDDVDRAFFHWCAHTDASRDMLRWSSTGGSTHRLGFDATPKVPGDEYDGQPVRDWPPIIRM